MGSGGGGGGAADGKKRKASVAAAGVEAPAKREPRRGMGVAELERIRVELEMAETCYAIVPTPLSSAAAAALRHLPPPAPAPCFVGHLPGVAMAHHHQYVGNGAVQVEYFTPYYRAQHYANDSLTSGRLFRSSGQYASPHQKNLVDQIQSAVTTAHPALGQAASSESSSSAASAYQLQDHRRIQPPQLGQTRKVAFVDLVDSDDDDGGAVEELDLELKL